MKLKLRSQPARINLTLWNTSSSTTQVRLFPPSSLQPPIVSLAISGTAHGFAARPNQRLPDIVEAYKKAMGQICSWFAKTV